MTPTAPVDRKADNTPMTPRVRVTGLGGFHAPAPVYACAFYGLSRAQVGYTFGYLPRLTPKQIVLQVARKYELTFAEITSGSRVHRIAHPRQEAMWRLRKETRLSLPKIARHVGVRDHTTVLQGIRSHEKRMAAE